MIVLDTNILSELMRPGPNANVLRWADLPDPDEFWLTAISVQEIVYGICRHKDSARRDVLRMSFETALASMIAGRILPFDEAAGRLAGEIAARLEHDGLVRDIADVQIAAIVKTHEAPLATRNVRHFQGLGLDLINPWESG